MSSKYISSLLDCQKQSSESSRVIFRKISAPPYKTKKPNQNNYPLTNTTNPTNPMLWHLQALCIFYLLLHSLLFHFSREAMPFLCRNSFHLLSIIFCVFHFQRNTHPQQRTAPPFNVLPSSGMTKPITQIRRTSPIEARTAYHVSGNGCYVIGWLCLASS